MPVLNPLAPEFKIPLNPLMPEIKCRRPGNEQYHCVLRFIVLSYSQNGFSKDFIMYVRDPGGFLVALDIGRYVNASEAAMEAACLVEEDGREVSVCLTCETEG